MGLEIRLSQKLSQSLVMTPQLQQAIKLLQLGRLEYLDAIENAILENPVLENIEVEHAEPQERSAPPIEDSDDDRSNVGLWSEGEFQIREDLADFSDYYPGGRKGKSFGSEESPSLEATISAPQFLTDHLLSQLSSLDICDNLKQPIAHIVGNLDHNGYLCVGLDEVCEDCRCEMTVAQEALELVQSLDPVGIAARDLGECLLLQLSDQGMEGTLAFTLARDHIAELGLKNYEQLSRALSVPLLEIYEAVKQIMKLEPRPARQFADECPIYIVPDIYVKRVGGEYVIALNEQGIPRLKVSEGYQKIVEGGSVKSSPENRDYLQGCIKSANWLMRIIEQRQNTIHKVTKSIMQHQMDFLEHGVRHLKPLVLKAIADDVGMHESTISRVTSNKYVHTPQGVFELKFFFSSCLGSNTGDVSSSAVKDKIKNLVSQENRRKPLSDQAIVKQLKQDGLEIARRTVAKYRDQLGILPSSKRKQMF